MNDMCALTLPRSMVSLSIVSVSIVSLPMGSACIVIRCLLRDEIRAPVWSGRSFRVCPFRFCLPFDWFCRCCDQVSAEEWDACASGCGVVNPFLMHAFLLALEITGCAVRPS